MKSSEQKEIEWKEKRRGKITDSTLPDLMKAGKSCPFGKGALDAMYLVDRKSTRLNSSHAR